MTTKVFPKFKTYDTQFVACKKRLKLGEADLSLEQPLSTFIGLPDELIHAVIIFSGIFAKSTLAQLCKKIYFLIDLQLEQKMYNATLNSLRKQDFKFKVDLEKWYMNNLVLRGCVFDDMEYFRAGLGSESLKISTNPFIKKGKRSDLLLPFNLLLEANAVSIFDYFVKENEKLEKSEDERLWKYIDNQDFQSFLWMSVSSLAKRLVVNKMPVKIIKGSIVDRIMCFASKYSHYLVRLITAHPKLSVVKFPALPSSSLAELLSDLLQHTETYPFDLTSVYTDKDGTYSLEYTVPPLEFCCRNGHFELAKVLLQHTPVLPSVPYLTYSGQIRTSLASVGEILDEFYNHGADVNATGQFRTQAKYINPAFFVDSALGVARFAPQRYIIIDPLVWIEWLLTRGAKFSDFEMSQIEARSDLMKLTEKFRKVISEGGYKSLSKPIINWQGPNITSSPYMGPCGQMRLLNSAAWYMREVPFTIVFEPDLKHCSIRQIGKQGQEELKGTWSSNESDNVITLDVPPLILKYHVFSAFNGTALLVPEEHLTKRGQTDTIVWLSGLFADHSWMTE